MLALVGNCPSSGSTLFADLLDSTEFTACGPELGLFSSEHFYSTSDVSSILARSSRLSDVYARRTGLFSQALPHYGFTLRTLGHISHRLSASEFLPIFTKAYLTHRKRNNSGIMFEKTPVNCNTISNFLTVFPSMHFVFMVRNPLDVLLSLKRRGFDSQIALTTWLLSAAAYYPFRNHPNLTCVRYEDLIKHPYRTTQKVLRKVTGQIVPTKEIRGSHEANTYRHKSVRRVPTWRTTEPNVVSDLPKLLADSATCEEFHSFLPAAVGKDYANLFHLAELTFVQALKEFGYADTLFNSLEQVSTRTRPQRSPHTAHFSLFQKWGRDFVVGDAKIRDASAYLRPVVYL